MNSTHDFTLKRNKNAAGIRLRIASGGKIVVTAPWYVPEFAIRAFVASKSEWIENHLSTRVPKKKGIPEKITLFGKETFNLKITEVHQKTPRIQKVENCLQIGISPLIKNKEKAVLDAIQIFYKQEAEQYFTEKLPYFAQELGVKYKKFTVKNQSSRWGSCSVDGNINLNSQLMLAPKDVIDYVIVHELCHLKEMNHSPAFWHHVASICPNYKILRDWLKRNGGDLMVE